MQRNKNGFIIMSEYFDLIFECLNQNGPSVFKEITNCIFLKINHIFRTEDLVKYVENRNRHVWEHQISEALYTLKKQGRIRLRNDKKYEI